MACLARSNSLILLLRRVGNAKIAGMATDLNLVGLRYNTIAAVFFVSSDPHVYFLGRAGLTSTFGTPASLLLRRGPFVCVHCSCRSQGWSIDEAFAETSS